MTSEIDSSIGTIWLGSATRPIVANTDVSAEQQRDRRADERAEHEQQDAAA